MRPVAGGASRRRRSWGSYGLAATTLLAMAPLLGSCTVILGLDEFKRPCHEEVLPPPPGKADLLLVLDNSRSMATKQQLLAAALPSLIRQLVNPPCVGLDGSVTEVDTPDTPCPALGRRQFQPLRDLHVGVLTSSLGGLGSDACAMQFSVTNDDRGHLVARKSADTLEAVTTYQDLGFLAWDPGQALSPPGTKDVDALLTPLTEMVTGAGAVGCGYAQLLEAPYRFLVEPDPYDSIDVSAGTAVLVGTDQTLLAQRRAFLRPDSVVVIVTLSDGLDCSVRAGGGYFFSLQFQNPNGTTFHLPAPRAECKVDPDSPCCASCGQKTPDGCPEAPECQGGKAVLDDLNDNLNVRCFDQKRRFGVDFRYPVSRYVAGFTEKKVTDRFGQVVDNPLFSDLDPEDGAAASRTPDRVLYAAIAGVPWQDVARQSADGKPDLVAGLDAQGHPVGGFQSALELAAARPDGHTGWDVILGDPDKRVPPLDPFMLESIEPRSGQNPITSDPIVQSGGGMVSPINGHERPVPQRDDLQFACVFDVPPRDCSDPNLGDCECQSDVTGSPLCDGATPTLQIKAGALPGTRLLQVSKALGAQGIVASICPPGMGDVAAAYGSAVRNIGDRVTGKLDVHCIERQVALDPDTGEVPCRLLEARRVGDPSKCDCPSPGRAALGPEDQALLDDARANVDPALDCVCEIPQATGEALTVCRNDVTSVVRVNGEVVSGFCYLDGAVKQGAPELTQDCESRRQLRVLGASRSAEGATLLFVCKPDASCSAE